MYVLEVEERQYAWCFMCDWRETVLWTFCSSNFFSVCIIFQAQYLITTLVQANWSPSGQHPALHQPILWFVLLWSQLLQKWESLYDCCCQLLLLLLLLELLLLSVLLFVLSSLIYMMWCNSCRGVRSYYLVHFLTWCFHVGLFCVADDLVWYLLFLSKIIWQSIGIEWWSSIANRKKSSKRKFV